METVPALTDSSIVYLYGFVSLPAQLPSMVGVEEGAAVFLIEYAHVACAASVVPAPGYQRDRSPQEQLEWATPRALRHHDVLCRLHASTPVIPLKFGTLCSGFDDVRTMLRDRHVAIGEQLARVAGKDEWTLRVTVDRAAFLERLHASEPSLAALHQQLASLPEGRAYLARKHLQQAAADCAAARLRALEHQLFDTLSVVPMDIVPLDMPPATSAGASPIGVAHAALLVERDAMASVEAALETFESMHAEVPVACELVGPWPPYSFAAALA